MKPIQNIPKHLKRFTLKQNYKLYTPMDQAGWRYIMHLSKDFFKDHAHKKYLSGLPATGITTDSIPRIEDMDKCLKRMGWRAAVVSGFIPPAVFLEFLSLGILPIACDMRTPGHLHYTPAPDIVHEAAGHAPILADAEYANYIRKYGEVSQKVIFSAEDLAVYNAIRKLSDMKEDPNSTEAEIAQANRELDEAVAQNTTVSEATQLSRMAWWTIEYGLVGSMDNPLIYGAGLLSSVGESYDAYVKNVKRVPLTLDCINVSYDITKPQPQLFVTPNFQHLVDVLEEFSQTMSYRLGAKGGLQKALEARTVTTTEWKNGLQVSGILETADIDSWKRPSFLKWRGASQISLNGKEIKGFGPKRFKNGLQIVAGTLETASSKELKSLSRKPLNLRFESGIKVQGKIDKIIGTTKGAKAVLLREAQINGQAARDVVIMLSDQITSVFGEAADRGAYYDIVPFMHEPNARQKTTLTAENKKLNEFYAEVRNLREKKNKAEVTKRVHSILKDLDSKHPTEWLLRMELLELMGSRPELNDLRTKLREQLVSIGLQLPDQKDLIARGLRLFA